ncbi:hypothetical protein FA15DRAFT_424800 [Coprinopsis marcescibilis]|uniref:Uncharacterized protein n=1 Tax=Coprinopsis marcescibilis TaxID=230819 RepID=A0A5C3LAM5_COPMA|nr:hypothetical protein FA15DRAFT_424800 [Coprinopsis marcescibilis]
MKVAEKTPQDQERLDAMASELQQLKEERARLQEKLAEMTSMEEDRTRRKGIFAAGSSTDETKLVMSRREKVLRKLFCL